MAVKEIYLMRLIASFGSFRKSKSTLALFFIYSLSGLGILPLIMSDNALSKEFIVGAIIQYPVLYLFPALFLFYSLISPMGVIDYERDFIFSSPIRSRDFFAAKTLYDLTLIVFILFLPFFISFIAILLMVKTFYIVMFSLIFLVLAVSVILENSFKVLILFYNRSLVRLLIILVLVAICAPVPFTLIYRDVPTIVSLISPIGSSQGILAGFVRLSDLVGPTVSILAWATFSVGLWTKASQLNFIPFAQVVPLRAAFDTSFRYQVQKQQLMLKKMGRFSIPVSFERAPKNKILFFAKESAVRTLRFGDLYGLLLTAVFLNLPYFFTGPSVGSQLFQQSSFVVLFVPIFFPIILTQLWITEFSDYFWILKTFSYEVRSYVLGVFVWQLLLFLPLLAISQIIGAFFLSSVGLTVVPYSLLLSCAGSAFGCFYGIWIIKRRSFTPYIYMMGMLFFVLVFLPLLVSFFMVEMFDTPLLFDVTLALFSVAYAAIVVVVCLTRAMKAFVEMEM
ncbi:MAG: hypothetical protein ACUVQ8_06810 [Nitrososphaeria archaeon]